MENRIELWVFPTGNVAVYRGSAFIPTEQLTEEERLFVLDRVCNELNREDLDAEIKKYTERLYNETFGNGQGTLDEFDWEDISTVIEDTAKHFYNFHSHWKPSEDEERLINTSVSFLKDFADKGYENAVECIDWLKSKLNGNSIDCWRHCVLYGSKEIPLVGEMALYHGLGWEESTIVHQTRTRENWNHKGGQP